MRSEGNRPLAARPIVSNDHRGGALPSPSTPRTARRGPTHQHRAADYYLPLLADLPAALGDQRSASSGGPSCAGARPSSSSIRYLLLPCIGVWKDTVKQHVVGQVLNYLLGAGRKLLERWVISYAAAPAPGGEPGGQPGGQQQGHRPASSRYEPAAIYKRMVIALRSLYSYVRMLPAYRLFRACTVRSLGVECAGSPARRSLYTIWAVHGLMALIGGQGSPSEGHALQLPQLMHGQTVHVIGPTWSSAPICNGELESLTFPVV